MTIRRRSLRKLLIAVGCVVGTVEWPAAAVGGLLLLAGSGLHLWSKGCLEQNRRLTTVGPYRWTRNPFYLANLLIDTGLCFVIGRWWVAAVFLAVWTVVYRATIAREEARLSGLFPDAFPDYRAAVPRLIPTGRRLPVERAEGSFSWNNDALARGSEYARLMGVWLAPAMICAAELLRRERLDIFAEPNSLALGMLAFLPCAWIVKLALAETFRRPETALVPFATRPLLRHGMTVLLVAVAIGFGSLWAASLPMTWCLLLALDHVGEARLDRDQAAKGRLWRYFPPIAVGSSVTFPCVAFLVRLSVG